jgi:hypothetical protein
MRKVKCSDAAEEQVEPAEEHLQEPACSSTSTLVGNALVAKPAAEEKMPWRPDGDTAAHSTRSAAAARSTHRVPAGRQ